MRRVLPLALLGAALLMLTLSAAGRPALAADPRLRGWTTLVSEDFESDFPRGAWHIGRTGDPYLWGKRACNPRTGAYSLWAGGGGSLGEQVACGALYTTGYVTTLSYGPLDLSDVTALRLTFDHWTWLGNGDSLSVGWSNDGGKSWSVLPFYGNAVSICDDWCHEVMDQSQWPIPLSGRTGVYLLFRFSSNATDVGYGSFLDNITLEAYREGGGQWRGWVPVVRKR